MSRDEPVWFFKTLDRRDLLLFDDGDLVDLLASLRDHLDEIFYMPSLFREQDMLYAVSYLARNHPLDRICRSGSYFDGDWTGPGQPKGTR